MHTTGGGRIAWRWSDGRAFSHNLRIVRPACARQERPAMVKFAGPMQRRGWLAVAPEYSMV
jgi:hypothetical protein